jgi:hypothetical protein
MNEIEREREKKGALKTANLGEKDRNHSCPRPGPTRLHTLRPPLRSYDQTWSRPVPRGPFLPAPHDAAPHDAAPLVSMERSTECDFSRPSSFFLKGNAVGEAPTVIFFPENKNPNSRLWRLEPEWLGCTSTSLTKWARLTSCEGFRQGLGENWGKTKELGKTEYN